MDCTIETAERSGALPVGAVPSAIMLYGSVAVLLITALLQAVPFVYGLFGVAPPVSGPPVLATPVPAATVVAPAGAGPTATPTATPGIPDEYTVQPGDTLRGIAQRFNVTPEALIELNGIEDPNLIQPGQVLKIPK
ncbi:MAG: LysM peptidoglycan-binding domain-containing protein [Firmicutes bacterium]|nr:LysM peptidoglycan-binding domain-containing protein [Bacillota bacterium]